MQSGFSVIQTITKPEHVSSGIAFIMIGIPLQPMLSPECSMHRVADISLAQLLSVSLALSICGTLFVNTALESLQSLLVDYSRTELQAALLGLSGEFLASLDSTQRAQTLSIIVESMAKVSVSDLDYNKCIVRPWLIRISVTVSSPSTSLLLSVSVLRLV